MNVNFVFVGDMMEMKDWWFGRTGRLKIVGIQKVVGCVGEELQGRFLVTSGIVVPRSAGGPHLQ